MRYLLGLFVALFALSSAAAVDVLPGTQPLTSTDDLSLKMVDDLHTFADRETAASIERRARHWNRDLSSPEAYAKSIEPNRKRLAKYLGVRDASQIPKVPEEMAFLEDDSFAGSGTDFQIKHYIQRRPEGFITDGFVWTPTKDGERVDDARVMIFLVDGDRDLRPGAEYKETTHDVDNQVIKFVRRGYTVFVPRLINRDQELSVIAGGARKTPQPHREFIYRQAFEMGRHVLGYEFEVVRDLLDYVGAEEIVEQKGVVVAGYGEGGLLALYSAALDPRISVVGVSGYFGPRERLFDEPIYRNVWGLLDEFGDAELAAMIAPNQLIVEASKGPEIASPNTDSDPKKGTPGALTTPPLAAVTQEVERARRLIGPQAPFADCVKLVHANEGMGEPISDDFVDALVAAHGRANKKPPAPDRDVISTRYAGTDDHWHHIWHRIFFQSLVDYTQALVRESEYVRKDFWKNADRKSRDPEKWAATLKPYRDHLYDEVLGRFDLPKLPPNARTRKVYDTDKFTGYEVVLDVFDGGVWAYGVLLVPKDIKPGERRPVVVCQHGLEGRPQHTIDAADPGENYYHHFAAQLAERGFVTFSPQNPYIGKDHFRQLVRKLYPLKKTLWSIIVPQHEQITDWLASLDFVDDKRIGFYGLSYGGKTAMRVPALVERYCLSICSGDFNEWIRKCTSVRDTFSYMGTHEYEMYEFDLGHTFNYAEMAYLIAPRPFMVERGHRDGVGIDEWVDYEYAKVRLLYADLKIPERTEIEHFDGPHTIHAVGTFAFLHRHLNWPMPQ